ncbi:hypothetical protein B0A55_10225 [Friedmanniomyces simplex]|uniref:Uncharacterized protein n=1 Tax=Friedmanniomyces simplex TaxID=329884 RepID=A0A4U0WKK9_9PEZI|nr:hypothetical protein B0A55_10225 [Friedmanniomyces simplex]
MLPIGELALLLATSSIAVSASTFKPCPVLGLVFAAPTSLCEADTFQAALKNLTATLGYASRSGGLTPYGIIPTDATSFSIGVFDTASTLFSYQYSSPVLQNGTAGVKNVKEDSIYRIGSGSKLITLAEAARKLPRCSASDAALFDLLATLPAGSPLSAYGLPQLPASDYPICGYHLTSACSEDAYLAGYASEHPLYAPYTTPVYSNGAFALLSLALENITGRSFPEMLQTDLFDKLGMTHSSYSTPNDTSDAVMPLGPIDSGFVADLGLENPYVLSHPNPHPRLPLSDHYQKPATPTVLIPDFNVGFAVLAAGNQTTSTVEQLSDMVVAAVVPALENTAREQSQQAFRGTYKASDGLASNITLTTRPGEPGLIISSWNSSSTDFLAVTAAGIYQTAAVDLLLYPTQLVQRVGSSNSSTSVQQQEQRVQYRTLVQQLGDTRPDGGDFLFEVDGAGKVISVSPRVVRTTLEKMG